jgi:malonate-semialdehyde dehydrogenase (acetylating)/methylmalonate-semialdehyde dehydrogenase
VRPREKTESGHLPFVLTHKGRLGRASVHQLFPRKSFLLSFPMATEAMASGSTNGTSVPKVDNFIHGVFLAPSTQQYLEVTNPANDHTIGLVGVSEIDDVQAAVQAAQDAFPEWSGWTTKARAAVMLKFHALVQEHAEELARLIVAENGKNLTEALADVAKGNETVEYSCSLPQLAQGKTLSVSSGGVSCQDRRVPLGVVASIVPFNFPFMVPMWTIPIALVMGNTMVLKPSEKVPLTMHRVASLLQQAGLPDGVFNMVQGTQAAVQALIAHEHVKAVTFVGSSHVAQLVATSCRGLHKRCTALGGAKNHLVALPDCDVESAARDICVSFAGCAGQRCMAASVLLLVGTAQETLLNMVVQNAASLAPGSEPGQVGPVIDVVSYDKILRYIAQAEQDGAKVLLDGRGWKRKEGCWIGPTVLLHSSPTDTTMTEEVFGPVLSVYVCSSWEEAIAIEKANEFGNAASIYTTNGANAEWFLSRFQAGMLGTNIGIPVPREPFSFGGLYGTKSKYGDMDITGDGGMEFFSNRIKITSKWPLKRTADTMLNGVGPSNGTVASGTAKKTVDQANFAGSM